MAGDIKLAHSIFALPFALLAAVLCGPSRDATADQWRTFGAKAVLVIVCMVLARTWAMLFNRLVDRGFDAANGRTARRVFASGRLSARTGWVTAMVAAALFVGASGLFGLFFANPWPLMLSVPVLMWIAFYSLTKRFTWMCHLFLGGALATSPIAAAIAVDPTALTTVPSLWWLACFVLGWVAGFDIIYALADEEFDRSKGLSSIPARLGTGGAIWASRVLHGAALVFLALAWKSEPRFSWIFGVAFGLVAALLALEHWIVWRRGKAGLDMAFFTVNGIVSCVLGVLGVIDVHM